MGRRKYINVMFHLWRVSIVVGAYLYRDLSIACGYSHDVMDYNIDRYGVARETEHILMTGTNLAV